MRVLARGPVPLAEHRGVRSRLASRPRACGVPIVEGPAVRRRTNRRPRGHRRGPEAKLPTPRERWLARPTAEGHTVGRRRPRVVRHLRQAMCLEVVVGGRRHTRCQSETKAHASANRRQSVGHRPNWPRATCHGVTPRRAALSGGRARPRVSLSVLSAQVQGTRITGVLRHGVAARAPAKRQHT